MCFNCYKELNKPAIINATTVYTAFLIEHLYDSPGGGAGGNLHIVTDDWNIDDEHLDFCSDLIKECETQERRITIEKMIIKNMREMSIEERASALAIYNNYI